MYPAGFTCQVSGRPDGGKDPTCPLWRGITTHNNNKLNRTGYRYRMTTGHGETAKRQLISHLISHLLYIDDLKLYGRNTDQLDGLLHTVRIFSEDIWMKFGLDKCAVAQFVNGRLSGHNSGVMIGKPDTINCLEPSKSTSTWV